MHQLCNHPSSALFRGVGVTLCYPGPIGGDAEVGRAVYGSEGIEMKREDEASAKKKMTVQLWFFLSFLGDIISSDQEKALKPTFS